MKMSTPASLGCYCTWKWNAENNYFIVSIDFFPLKFVWQEKHFFFFQSNFIYTSNTYTTYNTNMTLTYDTNIYTYNILTNYTTYTYTTYTCTTLQYDTKKKRKN